MLDLLKELILLVGETPGQTGKQYTVFLNIEKRAAVEKSKVNHVLYYQRDVFSPNHDAWSVPHWTLTEWGIAQYRNCLISDLLLEMPDEEVCPLAGITPYPWQMNAWREWKLEGNVGVIEAVTGSGKTMVAMMAMAAHLQDDGKVAVLVHTDVLQKQWVESINKYVNRDGQYSIGVLNGKQRDNLEDHDILVLMVQSACNGRIPRSKKDVLLIVDECHHYGTSAWSKALDPQFSMRMGLTATFERNDKGIEEYLEPYLNTVVYRLGYLEALANGVISPFTANFVRVELDHNERERYEFADANCRKFRAKLISDYGLPAEPFGAFIKEVNRIVKEGESAPWTASNYLASFASRRKTLADLSCKANRLAELADIVKASSRTIVFTQTIEGAKRAVSIFRKCGICCNELTSDMTNEQRESVIGRFREGSIKLIASPMILDEGVDIPVADVAIITASTRSRRQMIQRMGRVIRKTNSKKNGKIYVLYAAGTFEDPAEGAHEDFIEMLEEAAEEVNYI